MKKYFRPQIPFFTVYIKLIIPAFAEFELVVLDVEEALLFTAEPRPAFLTGTAGFGIATLSTSSETIRVLISWYIIKRITKPK